MELKTTIRMNRLTYETLGKFLGFLDAASINGCGGTVERMRQVEEDYQRRVQEIIRSVDGRYRDEERSREWTVLWGSQETQHVSRACTNGDEICSTSSYSAAFARQRLFLSCAGRGLHGGLRQSNPTVWRVHARIPPPCRSPFREP